MENDLSILIYDLLDQVNYALSDKFKEKWRYKFSTNFIEVFQQTLLKALENQRPVKRSTLTSTYLKKHKYSIHIVEDFYKSIDINLYYPLILGEPRQKTSSSRT
jgi:hypothetical protein